MAMFFWILLHMIAGGTVASALITASQGKPMVRLLHMLCFLLIMNSAFNFVLQGH